MELQPPKTEDCTDCGEKIEDMFHATDEDGNEYHLDCALELGIITQEDMDEYEYP